MATDKLDFTSPITSLYCEMNSHVRAKLKEHIPGHGSVLHGDTCLALLTILNFSPPPHVLEHSDQPVSKSIFLKIVEKILTKEQGLQINEPQFFRQHICKCELLISLFLLHQNVCVKGRYGVVVQQLCCNGPHVKLLYFAIKMAYSTSNFFI